MIHYWRPARQTIAAAQEAGLPLGAYPDKRFAKPGATPDTVRAILKLGDLHDKFGTVCEIGADSGRFEVHLAKRAVGVSLTVRRG